MLRYENRMAAERGLLAIVGDHRRRQALGDEILGVGEHCLQAFAAQVIKVFALQMKTAAKGRLCERGKKIVEVSHAVQGISMLAPVVMRASISRCACATSSSA